MGRRVRAAIRKNVNLSSRNTGIEGFVEPLLRAPVDSVFNFFKGALYGLLIHVDFDVAHLNTTAGKIRL